MAILMLQRVMWCTNLMLKRVFGAHFWFVDGHFWLGDGQFLLGGGRFWLGDAHFWTHSSSWGTFLAW